MFINESKILKKFYLGDKFSITIELVYYLNILPQLMFNSTKFKDGKGYRRQLTLAWLFWDITFYYEVKQSTTPTTTEVTEVTEAPAEPAVNGSFVIDYLNQHTEPTSTDKKEGLRSLLYHDPEAFYYYSERIPEDKTKRDQLEKMRKDFVDNYIDIIPKFFKEHYSWKWEEVRKNSLYPITKDESDFVIRDIVSNLFPNYLKVFNEVHEPEKKGFIITSSMIKPGAFFTNWRDEFTHLVKDLNLLDAKQWILQIAYKLGMYAFIPSYGLKNWKEDENEGDLVGKVQEAIGFINKTAEEAIESLKN